MATVGLLEEFSREFAVEWNIEGFFSLLAETDTFYTSPEFLFAGAYWCLEIFPNGRKNNIAKNGNTINSEGSVDLYLRRVSPGRPIKLECYLGLKDRDEKINTAKHFIDKFEENKNSGYYGIIRRSALLEREFDLMPSGVLTIVCKMESADFSSSNEIKKCSYCKMILDANEDLSSHKQKCLCRTIECSECNDIVALKNWFDHKCHMAGIKGAEKLLHDFNKLMLSGDHSDTVVKVKGEDFRLHRNILSSRNTYFNSMFKTDMKEKSTGVVTIEDCETGIFRSFIHFVHTGRVDKLSAENVCELYEAADRYQEDQLKDECSRFMMDTLSVDNFCDYFALAVRHDDKQLFQKGVELFTSKGKEIAHNNAKWKVFMKEYPTQANELFIKTLDHYMK